MSYLDEVKGEYNKSMSVQRQKERKRVKNIERQKQDRELKKYQDAVAKINSAICIIESMNINQLLSETAKKGQGRLKFILDSDIEYAVDRVLGTLGKCSPTKHEWGVDFLVSNECVIQDTMKELLDADFDLYLEHGRYRVVVREYMTKGERDCDSETRWKNPTLEIVFPDAYRNSERNVVDIRKDQTRAFIENHL